MIPHLLCLSVLLGPPLPRGQDVGAELPFSVVATLSFDSLAPGSTGELSIERWIQGRRASEPTPLGDASRRLPLVQILSPPGIELLGTRASTPAEFLRAAYLDLPHERLLEEPRTRVAFQVTAEVDPEAVFEFNLLYYPEPREGEAAHLVRRRYSLALRSGARARVISSRTSSWGVGPRLELGDRLHDMQLARVFGPEYTPADSKADTARARIVMAYHSCL